MVELLRPLFGLMALSLPPNKASLPTPATFLLTGVRGRLPSLPWILTAGALSNSEKRPLFPEALEQQWCSCEQVHQVSWVMNHRPLLPHSSLTLLLEMSQLQTRHLLKNEHYQPGVNPPAHWKYCTQYFISVFIHFVEVIWCRPCCSFRKNRWTI